MRIQSSKVVSVVSSAVSVAVFSFILSLTVLGQVSVAHEHKQEIKVDANGVETLCEFAPENDMKIPVSKNKAFATGISESDFNKAIDVVSKFYEPIVAAKGAKLQVNRLWTNDTVNASAQRQGNTWVLNMYGGLARHEITNVDGFALVVCHELGHHLGGFPRKGALMGGSWAANEGQSDYFGTMKCFRRVFEKADNIRYMSNKNVPAIVSDKCSLQHKSAEAIALCKRGAMAGLTLANLLGSLGGTGTTDFEKPDASVVASTNHNHPKAQCRLDTYFAGAMCGIAYNEDFSQDAPGPGACATEKGDKIGVRPLCWYKPATVR